MKLLGEGVCTRTERGAGGDDAQDGLGLSIQEVNGLHCVSPRM